MTQIDQAKLSQIARKYGVLNLRLFGSATKNWETARDLDFAVLGSRELTLLEQAGLISELEDLCRKTVDLIVIAREMPLLLASEIGSTSIAVWEEPVRGRQSYAVEIDRLMALAEDEKLSFPMELRLKSLDNQIRKFNVSGNSN